MRARAKYTYPIAVVTQGALLRAGMGAVPDVQLYEVRPVDSQNPMLDEDGNPTGKMLSDILERA